ncbi:MAG: hypothetical protein IH600_17195 [Bacteroidetes bacterium]|nr:hypothetical protein [Bacteroidota bacterium]
MHRFATILALLLLTSLSAKSQWPDWDRLPGPTGGMISSFAEIGGDIIAAPTQGAFYHSTDGGASWEFLYQASWTRSTATLHGSADGMLYALGYGGAYLSSDHGVSWTKCNPGGTALFAASAPDGTVLFGMRGSIAVSTDKGESWTEIIPSPGATRDYKVAMDVVGNWYAGAYETGVFLSTDRGATWTAIDTGLPNNAVYMVSVPAGDALYVGLNNTTYRSSDQGSTWEEISSLGGLNVYTIQHAGGNIMFAESTGGMLRSTDFGASWEQGPFAAYPMSNRIFANRNGTVLLSSAGRVLRSSDQGASFSISDAGLFVQNISQILSMKNGVLLVGNDGGGIYRSTDAGASWECAAIGRWGVSVQQILETARGSIYALCDGDILRSSDGGVVWTELPRVNATEISVSICEDRDTLLTAISDGSLHAYFESTGTHVKLGDIVPSGGIAAAALTAQPGGPIVLAGTDRGLYRSTDNGQSWNLVLVDGLPQWFTEIAANPTTWWGPMYASTPTSFFVAADDGSTWMEIPNLSVSAPRQLTFYKDGQDFAFVDRERILFYARLSKDWETLPPLPFQGLNAIAYQLPSPGVWAGRLLAGTATRGLFRSVQSLLNTPAAAAVPAGFSIAAVYPLPLSTGANALHLQLDMESGSNVTMEICDMLGRVLQRFERGTLPAGRSDIALALDRIPSSMLLLRVHGPGGTAQRLLPVMASHP